MNITAMFGLKINPALLFLLAEISFVLIAPSSAFIRTVPYRTWKSQRRTAIIQPSSQCTFRKHITAGATSFLLHDSNDDAFASNNESKEEATLNNSRPKIRTIKRIRRKKQKSAESSPKLSPEEKVKAAVAFRNKKFVEELSKKSHGYTASDKIKDQIYVSQLGDTNAVLKLHKDFYRALSAKSTRRMASLWLNTEKVTCDHPSGDIDGPGSSTTIVGYNEVMAGWKQAFSVSDEQFKRSEIKARDVRVQCRGSLAFVTATEEVTAPSIYPKPPSKQNDIMLSSLGLDGDLIKEDEGPIKTGFRNFYSSTCLYRKKLGQWYQVHYQGFYLHLAAAGLRGDMKKPVGFVDHSANGSQRGQQAHDGRVMRGPLVIKSSMSPDDLRKLLEGKANLGSILGSGTNIIGGSSGPAGGGGGGGGLGGGRLGRPSLEEILNMDDDDDDEDEDDEDDIIEEDYDEVMDSVDVDRRRRRENNNSNNNKISNGSSGGSGRLVDAIQKEGRGRDSNDKSATTSSSSSSPDPSPGQASLESDGRDYTRETVNVIRRLSKDGLISTVEKRLLVADIIQQATREDPSPVQIAYELLLSDTENVRQTTETIKNANTNTDMDKSDATTSTEGGGVIDLGVSAGGGSLELSYDEDDLLEFADQCKLFAARLAGGNQQQQKQ